MLGVMTGNDAAGGHGYGTPLWEPDARTVKNARVSRYMRWLADRGTSVGDYAALWAWSVTRPGDFWASIWDYFDVLGDRGDGPALTDGIMPDVHWFPGAALNYARNALRTAWTDPGRAAIIFSSERGRAGSLSYAELAAEVARVARGLRALGVRKGDRVVALLGAPGIKQILYNSGIDFVDAAGWLLRHLAPADGGKCAPASGQL